MSIPVSVYIICKNEENHIERVLESVKDFDEIIVVDSGSTDATLDICSRYTKGIYQQKWLGFSKQKEYAKNLCSNEWVLNLDADEEISDLLKEEIVDAVEMDALDGLDIRISSQYMGEFNHPYAKYNSRIRFFRKSLGHYPEKLVHESICLTGNIGKAKGFIYEYGVMDLRTHIFKK